VTSNEQQYFVLGHRLSKHKTTRHARNLGEWSPPGYVYELVLWPCSVGEKTVTNCSWSAYRISGGSPWGSLWRTKSGFL